MRRIGSEFGKLAVGVFATAGRPTDTGAEMATTKQPVIVWDRTRTNMVSGFYAVENGVLTVASTLGVKSSILGGSSPEALAQIMLRELADDADHAAEGMN